MRKIMTMVTRPLRATGRAVARLEETSLKDVRQASTKATVAAAEAAAVAAGKAAQRVLPMDEAWVDTRIHYD